MWFLGDSANISSAKFFFTFTRARVHRSANKLLLCRYCFIFRPARSYFLLGFYHFLRSKLFERPTSESPVLLKKPKGLAKDESLQLLLRGPCIRKYPAKHGPAKAVCHVPSCAYFTCNSNKQLLCMTTNIIFANFFFAANRNIL